MRDLPEDEFKAGGPEVPFSPEAEHVWEPRPTDDSQADPLRRSRAPRRTPGRPDTELQALMETAPGDEPEASAERLNVPRDRVAQAVDRLAPREQWVVEAHMWRGMTFQEIAEVLSVSKQVAHRIFQSALGHLRADLDDVTEA